MAKGGAVVLVSGGVDSTVVLAQAVKHFGAEKVTALTLFYGQRHKKELESAKAVATHYGVKHMIKDLSGVFDLSDSPLLASSHREVPEGSYADAATRDADGMSKTYVPYRNGLFLSYAAAIAYSLGAGSVGYGAHADDAAGNAYPDCAPDFFQAQEAAVFYGTGQKVRLTAPLLNMTKPAIVATGLELGAPFHLTWSCYNGGEKACGKCGTCRDRKRAFEILGGKDPIDYAE